MCSSKCPIPLLIEIKFTISVDPQKIGIEKAFCHNMVLISSSSHMCSVQYIARVCIGIMHHVLLL